MKSLEVSEEKANQRVEEFKRQLKSLTGKLKEAENRAELAEKTVKKLQKEVDRLEGMFLACFQFFLFFFLLFFTLFLNQNKKLRKNFSLVKKKTENYAKCLSYSQHLFDDYFNANLHYKLILSLSFKP